MLPPGLAVPIPCTRDRASATTQTLRESSPKHQTLNLQPEHPLIFGSTQFPSKLSTAGMPAVRQTKTVWSLTCPSLNSEHKAQSPNPKPKGVHVPSQLSRSARRTSSGFQKDSWLSTVSAPRPPGPKGGEREGFRGVEDSCTSTLMAPVSCRSTGAPCCPHTLTSNPKFSWTLNPTSLGPVRAGLPFNPTYKSGVGLLCDAEPMQSFTPQDAGTYASGLRGPRERSEADGHILFC